MSPFRGVALTLRFVCELAMLAALAYSGAELGTGIWAWILAIAAPAAGQPALGIALAVVAAVTSLINAATAEPHSA